MSIIANNLINSCDKESKIYCKSYNSLQRYLKNFEDNNSRMNDMDLSSLGLYLCKCVEQEINSTVVQLIRHYLGIDMPDYYCKVDPNFSRYDAAVDTGNGSVRHWVYFNDYRDYCHKYFLKPIPLGEAYRAICVLLEEDPDWFFDYPVLNNCQFKETWRSISRIRNEIAHSGTIIRREILNECFKYCLSFLREYMPKLAAIKDELAPNGWLDDSHSIDIEPSVIEPPKTKSNGVEVILSQFQRTEKPKASPENYEYWKTLKIKHEESISEDFTLAENYFNLLIAYENQFDWFDIPFEEKGRFGLKDILGEVVIPAKYDDFWLLQSIIKDYSNVQSVKKGNHYGLVERYSGKENSEFVYDCIWKLDFHNCFFFQKDGSNSYGIISANGEIMIPCVIDKHWELKSGLIYKSGEKYGFFSWYYDLNVPPVYDDLIVPDLNEPFIFVIDGVEGCISNEGIFYTKEHLRRMKDSNCLEYVEEADLLMEPED